MSIFSCQRYFLHQRCKVERGKNAQVENRAINIWQRQHQRAAFLALRFFTLRRDKNNFRYNRNEEKASRMMHHLKACFTRRRSTFSWLRLLCRQHRKNSETLSMILFLYTFITFLNRVSLQRRKLFWAASIFSEKRESMLTYIPLDKYFSK